MFEISNPHGFSIGNARDVGQIPHLFALENNISPRQIFFDKLFFESYSFLTLHQSYFTERHETVRKHENSEKTLILGVLSFFVEGHCTRSVNLH